ncbi:FAD-dependent 5-carboxymethylaminomethyl-2-thiouridine(34) oxidoreductase MnmC [Alcaligenaceae bacterium A4P071]|nr:FAD-dependent 5-carboxymethylaminomethyl-2-thiouridine(34) oxidoreductase MnmC [Alcaligenaceae bacterium A4P071]
MPSSPTYALPDPLAALDNGGTLHSARFNETYHARTGAFVRATRIFMAGTDTSSRWRGTSRFTVADIGFGVGINFLTLWEAWRRDPQRPRSLHVLAFEGYPLAADDLRRALTALVPQAMMGDVHAMLAQWPARLPGVHRLEFEGGRVTLTLALGDLRHTLPQSDATVDAFFLDGFSPTRNPEMYTADVMAHLARQAAPGARLASWVTERAVVNALCAAQFDAEIVGGAGGGLMMTQGTYAGPGRKAMTASPDHVLVVGGGIAGAGIAQALALRGAAVTVLDAAPAGVDQGVHAGHRAAALTPLISRDDDVRARLSRAGSHRAQARWLTLPGAAAPVRCGTVQLARDDAQVAVMADTVHRLGFPADWVRAVDAGQASALAGLDLARGGVYFSCGMRIDPHALIVGLLGTPGVKTVHADVRRLSQDAAGQWCAHGADDAIVAFAPIVVVANAADAPRLLAPFTEQVCPGFAKMHALAGEVSFLPAQHLRGGPRRIVGGQGYLLPATEGYCVAGSTYAHGAAVSAVTPDGRAVNIEKVRGLLAGGADTLSGQSGGTADWASMHSGPDQMPGWAGWRAVLPGRLPAIGAVPDRAGLWVATGYASRGLSWSALAGDLISATLFGEPSPLETGLQHAIAPR